METIVRQTREVGTSAGVLLPRNWLGKQVVVTLYSPSQEVIGKEVIEILLKSNLGSEIKGIYLYGSYARGDYDSNSDIDILVLTNKTNKTMKSYKYEITLITEKNFSKNTSSLYYQTMLSEYKTILNQDLMDKYSKSKLLYDLKEIEKIIKINKETIEFLNEKNKNIPDGIIYSVILRLRELYSIKCLLKNKKYSKSDFLKIVSNDIYNTYSGVKKNIKEKNNSSPTEIIKLVDLSEKWLKELKD